MMPPYNPMTSNDLPGKRCSSSQPGRGLIRVGASAGRSTLLGPAAAEGPTPASAWALHPRFWSHKPYFLWRESVRSLQLQG